MNFLEVYVSYDQQIGRSKIVAEIGTRNNIFIILIYICGKSWTSLQSCSRDPSKFGQGGVRLKQEGGSVSRFSWSPYSISEKKKEFQT